MPLDKSEGHLSTDASAMNYASGIFITYVVVDKNGNQVEREKLNLCLRVVEIAEKQMLALAKSLGLSPDILRRRNYYSPRVDIIASAAATFFGLSHGSNCSSISQLKDLTGVISQLTQPCVRVLGEQRRGARGDCGIV